MGEKIPPFFLRTSPPRQKIDRQVIAMEDYQRYTGCRGKFYIETSTLVSSGH